MCEYVMCVWGGVKGATDKHFRKGKIDTLEPSM